MDGVDRSDWSHGYDRTYGSHRSSIYGHWMDGVDRSDWSHG